MTSFKMASTTNQLSAKTSQYLYTINVWLGFLPPLTNHSPNDQRTTSKAPSTHLINLSKLRTYLILTITSTIFLYCLTEGNETDGYEKTRPHFATHVVLTHVSFICMYISILITFLHVRLKNGDAILRLLSELTTVDAKFGKTFIPDWKFTLEVVVSIVLVVCYLIYEEIERNMFHIYASIRKIFIVASVILALQIHSFGIQFRLRFKQINRLLKQMSVGKLINVQSHDVGDVYGLFVALVNCVVQFNRIFGWQILYLCGTFVSCVLHVINTAIMVLNYYDDLDEISGHFWGVFVMYLLTTLVICIPFASSCNDAAEEAKTTSLLAYALLAQKQKKLYGLRNDHFKNLELLAAVSWPGFSAAGFFDVDHTMLFTLFGSVTSYLIVLIQLKDMQL